MFKTIRNLKKINKVVDSIEIIWTTIKKHKDIILDLKEKIEYLVAELKEIKESKNENGNSTPTM